jgi:hypothetical protein
MLKDGRIVDWPLWRHRNFSHLWRSFKFSGSYLPILQTCLSIEFLPPAFIKLSFERFQVWTNAMNGRTAAAAAVASEEEKSGHDADDGGTSNGDADDLSCDIS